MLTKIDVDMYLYKQYKHLINTSNKSTGTNTKERSFVVKANNDKRIYAICRNISSAGALTGFNSYLYVSRNTSDIVYKDVWKFVQAGSSWEVNYAFESIEDLDKALLANQKAFALDEIYDFIEDKRILYSKHDSSQSAIYLEKYKEALEVVKSGMQEDAINQYPYVNAYARYKGVSLFDAAQRIIFKKESLDCVLAELETLRIQYKNLICQQTTQQGVKESYEQFFANNAM
jgi:hypothetical protein